MKLAPLAALVTDSLGEFTGVRTVLLGQLDVQDGSPPPPAPAVLAIVAPAAAAVAVTTTVKFTGELVARPAGIEQVRTWPAIVQPAGAAPSASVDANVSVIVVTAVVAALPVLVTVSV